MKRLEVQTLRSAARTLPEIAAISGVSARTVQRICGEEKVKDPAKVDRERRARMGRPSKVAEHVEEIERLLRADPSMPAGVIAERLREQGCAAGKSAIYAMVKSLRPERAVDGIVRFEAVAGEFSQHDFGQVRVRYANGVTETLKFFASRLKFSRLVRVTIVNDETTESVCWGLLDAFHYFGGVPLLSVFDNPRTITTGRKDGHPIWQATFAGFCAELGVTPMATWPYRPQEKGSVENLVGFVKCIFKGREFRDREDLLAKLAEWHVHVNDVRPSRATGEVPRTHHLLEVARLKPLVRPATGFSLKWPRRVRTDGYCEFEGKRFFAGNAHIGKMATLHVEKDAVEIFVGGAKVARHPRAPRNGKYSILPDQRPQVLEKKGGRSYVKRQLLIDLCPAAEWSLTEIRHRRSDRWEEDVARIFELLEQHGDDVVARAFEDAARANVAGAEYIEALITGEALAGGAR